MTPIESAARNMARQYYYRLGHQPSAAVEGYVDNEWRDHVDDARAAIEAIREPNEVMVQAVPSDRNAPIYPEDIWQAMIDAALADS